ncbi:DinB family protein [Lewinella sp. W8]|uniref:DinB family protein n=1 Tax=Lewinella sp. W8 TaxID=2528208 RepID=UPI001067FCC8|nr:DinB family protein [Lewinella sp. W8]MTB52258.1 DinB family protein [Lewinella sp. W8]
MSQQIPGALSLLRPTRENILRICRNLSAEQLNTVPEGFNNNLIWNAGHVIATQELLTYGLSSMKTPSGREFIDRYRKGTRPEGPVHQAEIDHILQQLEAGVDQLAVDLSDLTAANFREYETSYGVTLRNLSDAMTFNNMHEAMHLGTMLAMRKLV